MPSSPYVFHLSKCKTTLCVYSHFIFFVCLCLSWLCRKDSKADACAWGMEKGSACPLCIPCMQQFLWGRWGWRRQWWVSSSSPEQFPHWWETLPWKAVLFLLQHELGWKAFVEHPRITCAFSFSLKPPWQPQSTPAVALPAPSLCRDRYRQCLQKLGFFLFNIHAYEPEAGISPNQEGFLSCFASKKAFLCNINICWWLQETHRETFLLVC